ncbi:MAG: hypothetical protein ACJ8AW_30250 [Rhodopila sp.]
MVEIIPLWLVNVASFATVFSVMAAIGTTIIPRECFRYVEAPSLLVKGIVTAIVIVPVVGIVASFAFGLSLPEKVGIALIVIAPGAPLALRRALGSGAHAGFAPTLQIALALLAVPAVPAWVMICNIIFGTHGDADPVVVAKQVFLAQLLPLALGAAMKQAAPIWADLIGRLLGRAGAALLLAAILFQIVDLYQVILSARLRGILVAATTTIAALLVGHIMGASVAESWAFNCCGWRTPQCWNGSAYRHREPDTAGGRGCNCYLCINRDRHRVHIHCRMEPKSDQASRIA